MRQDILDVPLQCFCTRPSSVMKDVRASRHRTNVVAFVMVASVFMERAIVRDVVVAGRCADRTAAAIRPRLLQ